MLFLVKGRGGRGDNLHYLSTVCGGIAGVDVVSDQAERGDICLSL